MDIREALREKVETARKPRSLDPGYYSIEFCYEPEQHAAKCTVLISEEPEMVAALWGVLEDLGNKLGEASRMVEAALHVQEDTL